MNRNKMKNCAAAIVSVILVGFWCWTLGYAIVYFANAPVSGDNLFGVIVCTVVLGGAALLVGSFVQFVFYEWENTDD